MAGVIQVFGLPLDTIQPIPGDLITTVFGDDPGTIQECPTNVITISDESQTQNIQDIPQIDTIITSPQGPPGADGEMGESAVDRIAAQALGGHRVVKPVANGEVDYASHDVPTDGDLILGITKHAAVAGDTITVTTGGTMENTSWTWAIGPIYCGLNGVLTQTVPATGFMCRVAKALSPTVIFVNVEEAILLI